MTLKPQKFLPHFSFFVSAVNVNVKDIKDVSVEEQKDSSIGMARQVALVLESGIRLGITEVFTSNPVRYGTAPPYAITFF